MLILESLWLTLWDTWVWLLSIHWTLLNPINTIRLINGAIGSSIAIGSGTIFLGSILISLTTFCQQEGYTCYYSNCSYDDKPIFESVVVLLANFIQLSHARFIDWISLSYFGIWQGFQVKGSKSCLKFMNVGWICHSHSHRWLRCHLSKRIISLSWIDDTLLLRKSVIFTRNGRACIIVVWGTIGFYHRQCKIAFYSNIQNDDIERYSHHYRLQTKQKE